MVLTYHYKELKIPGLPLMKRPMIPVTFSNNDESFETMGLLDSGADFTAFTKDIADTLGLDLSGQKEKAMGVGGMMIDTVRTKVKMTLEKGHERYTLTIPVKVLMVENSMTPPLLGRVGFFDEFKITFEERSKKIHLKKCDKADRKWNKARSAP